MAKNKESLFTLMFLTILNRHKNLFFSSLLRSCGEVNIGFIHLKSCTFHTAILHGLLKGTARVPPLYEVSYMLCSSPAPF